MKSKDELKLEVCAAIDARRDEIIQIGETILANPETGFREVKTAGLVAEHMERLGLRPQTGLALTGVKGRAQCSGEGPTLALLGELDSLCISDHPHADPETGAAHACGHHAQVTGMLGAAMGLLGTDVLQHLAGALVFFAVPAEEFIEVEHRMRLKEEGKLEFLTGKSELIRLGHFDDVDLAMMFHTKTDTQVSHISDSSNGSVIKRVRFIGKAAHAGSQPQLGINALNAANLALAAIAFQRETFWDDDTIRIHPIITRGGDAVSSVPADVRLETFIRGKTIEGIVDANRKVDNALRGAALCIGAQVDIETVPGYLPQVNNGQMAELWGENVRAIFGDGHFRTGGHRASSTDMGDLGHIMPVIHPYLNGARGVGHGNDYVLEDKEKVYVTSAKLLAMTVIDLMYDQAATTREVLADQRPRMTKPEYVAFQRSLNAMEHYEVPARE